MSVTRTSQRTQNTLAPKYEVGEALAEFPESGRFLDIGYVVTREDIRTWGREWAMPLGNKSLEQGSREARRIMHLPK
jgi:hypothetical protein